MTTQAHNKDREKIRAEDGTGSISASIAVWGQMAVCEGLFLKPHLRKREDYERNVEIKARLASKEFERPYGHVTRSHLSRENYWQQLMDGYLPTDPPPPAHDYVKMKELYQIGNNLNQIAQKAHVLNMVNVHDTAV